MQASAAAPAPSTETCSEPMSLSCISAAFIRAAAVMMAVPCWSSWKTGMLIRSSSAASTSKHAGAPMSSRLMPPKVGSSAATTSMKCSGSRAFTSMSKTSMSANRLKSTALPSITGLAARGPMFPNPRTALPSVTTPTRFRRAV